MTNISDVIREYIANGGSTEDLVAEFSNALNDIEQAMAEEEAAKEANTEEMDVFCDTCWGSVCDRVENGSTLDAGDVADFAVWMAYNNVKSDNWTLEDFENFRNSVKSSVELNMSMIGKSLDEIVDIASNHVANELEGVLKELNKSKETCGTDRKPSSEKCSCKTKKTDRGIETSFNFGDMIDALFGWKG